MKSEKGIAGGVATLDSNGHILASQLPAYVDDVIEGQYINSTEFIDTEGNVITPESGKVYVDISTGNVTSGKTYRWSGSVYTVIGNDLALGTTSATAFRGDLGQLAYEHSQKTRGNPHNVTATDVGLGNVPNVATNNQTVTYSNTSTLATLVSGEKISTAFAKIKLAITNLINHIANKSNPHGVTAENVGLGNVENKSSETIRSEITSDNVVNGLGYTPLKPGEVLWTNGGVSAEFPEQTVTLSKDISNFNYYEVEYALKNSNTSDRAVRFKTGKIPKSAKTQLCVYKNIMYVRAVSAPSGTSILFGNSIPYSVYGVSSSDMDNTCAVPVRVIGYYSL